MKLADSEVRTTSTGGGNLLSRSLFWALFFFAPASHASHIPSTATECSEVDLRPVFPQDIRNQGEISWCYANAAADYLQFLHRIREPISAADIAIRYSGTDVSKLITFFQRIFSRESRSAPPETGLMALAIKKAIPEGWCPESYLPSFEWNRIDASSGSIKKQDIMKSILETYSLQKAVLSGKLRTASELPAYFEFPQIDRDTFFKILKQSRKSSLLSEIRSHACKGARRPYPGRAQAEFRIKGKQIFHRIHQALNRQEPISIDFFSDIFHRYDGYRRKISDLHTVLIYGRKFSHETGECMYLMRNSYGTDCSQYDPRISCEAGYLWFPERKLFSTLTSTVRVKIHP
jgi:hypothetical protein